MFKKGDLVRVRDSESVMHDVGLSRAVTIHGWLWLMLREGRGSDWVGKSVATGVECWFNTSELEKADG